MVASIRVSAEAECRACAVRLRIEGRKLLCGVIADRLYTRLCRIPELLAGDPLRQRAIRGSSAIAAEYQAGVAAADLLHIDVEFPGEDWRHHRAGARDRTPRLR